MFSICFFVILSEETLDRMSPSYFCSLAMSFGILSASTTVTSTCWERRAAARAWAWLRSFSASSTCGRPRTTRPQPRLFSLDRVAVTSSAAW
jgi:hypothetical protein